MKKSELKNLIREIVEGTFGGTSNQIYNSLKGKTIAKAEKVDHVLVITFTDGSDIHFDEPQMIGYTMAPPTNS